MEDLERTPETDEGAGTRSRMPDDMKTMAAILRLLSEHDQATAADIMEYVYRRARRNSGVPVNAAF